MTDDNEAIIFFDGFCVLCNHFAKWVIAKDPQKKFKFSTLDSERAQKVFAEFPELKNIDSVILYENGRTWNKGAAVRKIIQELSTSNILKKFLCFTPDYLLSFGYDFVAKTRYKIFGKYEVCPLPTPEQRERFI